jgi:hypothetical protein
MVGEEEDYAIRPIAFQVDFTAEGAAAIQDVIRAMKFYRL